MDCELFDKRGYPIVDVTTGYTLWSKSYGPQVMLGADLRLLDKLSSVDWKSQKKVLDVACGTGRMGNWLREKGAGDLFGLDTNGAMVEEALQNQIYKEITIRDMADTGLPDKSFDLVLNALSLEHVEDLDPVFKETYRICRSGGYFVAIGFHPYFQIMGVPTHFKDETGQNLSIKSYVHNLSDFFRFGKENGWDLIEFKEQCVDKILVNIKSSYEKHLHKPFCFAMVWKKQK